MIEDFDRAIEQLGDAVTAPLLFERARAMLSLQEPAMVRVYVYCRMVASPVSTFEQEAWVTVLATSGDICSVIVIVTPFLLCASAGPHHRGF